MRGHDMTQDDLIARVTAEVAGLAQVRALFLGGSYGRGSADSYSDIDLIALVDAEHCADIAAAWRNLLESITRVVFWRAQGRGPVLINAITHEWLRCDIFVVAPAAFTSRAKDSVRLLIDPEGFYERLPPTLPPIAPDTGRVTYLINEFIRILGLLSVVVGRAEYFTAASGAGVLRDHLMSLMLEEVPLTDRGGALHLSRLLPTQQMEALRALPFPKPERGAVIDAHFAIARQFFPRARALASRLGIAWPDEFEAATRRHLQTAFGAENDVSW
jgi:predicted nucleotidyltransferase